MSGVLTKSQALVPQRRLQLYSIHGLLVESELPLAATAVGGGPGAPANGTEDGPVPDYRISEGEVRVASRVRPPGRLLAELCDGELGYWVTEDAGDPDRWTLRYAGVCDVILDRGRRSIVVHRCPDAVPGMVEVFVGGSVLAHALSADGRLVMHASAVEVSGQALAIAGPSGAGKSTLAALLCAGGARLVADDALRCEVRNGAALCFPGARTIRLRPSAAALAARIGGGGVDQTADRRLAVSPASSADASLRLRSIVVPLLSSDAEALEVERLGAMDGLIELIQHPRLAHWRASEQIAGLFGRTAELAQVVDVFRATVPWGQPLPADLAGELLSALGLRGDA
jgi:hypothetical protein